MNLTKSQQNRNNTHLQKSLYYLSLLPRWEKVSACPDPELAEGEWDEGVPLTQSLPQGERGYFHNNDCLYQLIALIPVLCH